MEAHLWARDEGTRTLFRRCLKCPSTPPSCGSCPSGQICQLNPQTCEACASTSCISASSVDGAAPTTAPTPQSPAGPVAGGVVGGVILIAIVVFAVYWCCIRRRKRRQEYDPGLWNDYNMGSEKDMNEHGLRRSQRASTHTVASFASSALTRASNIIPIAYIPGVTNRSVHSSQGLVPPVPPIPAASPGGSPQIDGDESHYFVPRDLHDSTYDDPRRSLARTSIASTIYRNNAIVSPVPAQMISRAKPTAVSVRSNGRSPIISRSSTPPVPTVPHSARTLDSTQSSIVARVGVPKSVQIKKSSSLRKVQHQHQIYELDGSGSEAGSLMRKPSADAAMSPNTDASESDDEHGAGRRLVDSNHLNPTTPSELGDYDDERLGQNSTVSLNKIIEEAAMQASRGPAHTGPSSGYVSPVMSPFSDEHAARTP